MLILLDVSFPVFALILCGYLAGRSGLLGPQSARALNGFVYYFALPALLFSFTAEAPIAVVLNWPFIGAILGASLAAYIIAIAVGWFLFGQRFPVVGLSALTGVFANTGYLGIPLFLTAFGPENVGPAIVATVAVNIVFVGGTVALLEMNKRERKPLLPTIWNILAALAKNPLVSAPIIALPFSFYAVELTSPISRFMDLLGSAAGPAALFAIGMSFVNRTVGARPSEIGTFVAIKICLHPLLTWIAVTYVFDMEPFWASSAVLLSALPTAAVAFVIAQERQIYVAQVSSIIVVSTVASVFVVSALLIALPA